jgi:hypothetical protein
MRKPIIMFLSPIAVVLALTGISLPSDTRAQAYPIDCAILLCLSGGWPASVPCARARAEFIRRITPWPVEPPLQIWRCPMGASHETIPSSNRADRLFEAAFETNGTRLRQSFLAHDIAVLGKPVETVWRFLDGTEYLVPADRALRQVQERADIDISGQEFNFVRSIRVFDVRYARQRRSGREGECTKSARIYLGTYGVQGAFSWSPAAVGSLPAAHRGLESWGLDCPSVNHRSVFVEWRDFYGNYGFEQVNY